MDYTSENILMYAKELSVESDEIINFISSVNPVGYPEIIDNIVEDHVRDINAYPESHYLESKKMLAKVFDVESNQLVFGNGASEVVYSFINFLKPEKALLIDPVLVDYKKALGSVGCDIDFFYLKEDDYYVLDIDRLILQLENKYDLVVICNPINPTGTIFDKNDLIKVFKIAYNYGTKIILDESFMDFTDDPDEYSFLKSDSKIKEIFPPSVEYDGLYRNNLKVELFPLSHPEEFAFLDSVVVVRSFTKFFSIPGLRVGFAFSHNSDMMKKYDEKHYPFVLNIFAQKAAGVLYHQLDYIEESRELIQNEREFLMAELNLFRSIKVFPSKTNFIMFKLLSGMTALELKEKLISDKILIRDLSSHDGMGEGFVRITVQMHDDNKILIEALKKYLD